MNLSFCIKSMYICVKDMNRAINFYEKLLNQKVSERNEIYSVFDINGFRYGLFAYQLTNENKTWGNNCLPSIEVNDIERFIERIHELNCSIVFPTKRIGKNMVLEFTDSEGNTIEATSPIKNN
jgi:predicted enzyme related to lactoylglutathione lyase